MQIELAKNSDARIISLITQQLIGYGLTQPYSEARVKRIISHVSKNLAVAKVDSRVVGFGMMSYYERTASLDLLGIRREFQQEGIGTTLVAWLEKVAINLGIQSTYVQVGESNRSAINFYRQLGYVVSDGRCKIYGQSFSRDNHVKLAKLLYEPLGQINI